MVGEPKCYEVELIILERAIPLTSRIMRFDEILAVFDVKPDANTERRLERLSLSKVVTQATRREYILNLRSSFSADGRYVRFGDRS